MISGTHRARIRGPGSGLGILPERRRGGPPEVASWPYLLSRNPELDLVRVQDVGLARAHDRVILEWAAREGRVLLTHDVTTMTKYADERLERGEAMPGVIEVGDHLPIGRVIEDILLLAECSRDDEWEGRVDFLPL